MLSSQRLRPALCIFLCPTLFAGNLVTSVSVPGSNLQVNLATQVGQPYDAATIDKDLHYLWNLGRFDDIRVETSKQDDGVAVVFRTEVEPIRFLRQIRVEPNSFGLEIKVPANTPLNDFRAHGIAAEAERQLRERGYGAARVQYDMRPAPQSQVDLRLTVDTGDPKRVTAVHLQGDQAYLKSLRALRFHRILFWRLLPSYSQEAVDADIARVQSAYLANGYLDAVVRPGPVETVGKDAIVSINVTPGERRPVDRNLCSSLFQQRREAQKQGILDFTAKIDTNGHLSVDLGKPYRVGKITFTGNHIYKDSMIRRNFVIDEGQIFDERQLRRSVANLNRTNLFENIDPRQVTVQPDEKTGLADVTVRLRERKRGSWNISGPVGPASLAGPLSASISSHLPPWGQGLLELSTYTASLSLLAFYHPIVPILNAPKAFIPIFALRRPYMPGEGWRSGLVIAPQLGWQATAVSYGVTQLEQRLLPLMQGSAGLEPELDVTVERPEGEAVMFCEAPKPRFGIFRTAGSMSLRFMGSLASF